LKTISNTPFHPDLPVNFYKKENAKKILRPIKTCHLLILCGFDHRFQKLHLSFICQSMVVLEMQATSKSPLTIDVFLLEYYVEKGCRFFQYQQISSRKSLLSGKLCQGNFHSV